MSQQPTRYKKPDAFSDSKASDKPSDKKEDIKKTSKKPQDEKTEESEKRKKLYIRLFFYAFCGTFIIGGLIILAIFINAKDPDIFGNSKKYYEQALQDYKAGEYDSAEKLLERCISINGENADAIVLLADIYQTQSKFAEAEKIITDGINFSGMNEKNEALYKKMLQLYTAQNKIAEAYDFLSNIDSYVRTRIASARPSALRVSPGQGSYESEVKITIEVPDACTVYYTTDNTLPNKDSAVYVTDETEIKVSQGATVLRAFALNEAGLLSDESVLRFTVYNDNTQYDFKDPKIESIVRANLNQSSGTILYKDLATLSTLTDRLSSVSSSKKIKTLEDLQAMTNLKELTLTGENSIENFDALSTMTSLTSLTLSDCGISNDSANIIFSLKNLQTLNLSRNGISDITKIASMSALQTLDLSQNLLTSLSPLSGLTGLTTLKVANNKITTLTTISSNTALTELDISSNATLSSLEGLTRLTKLQTINASNTPISSISELSQDYSLLNLQINSTAVTDLSPLSGLRTLTTLDISKTVITDFSALAGINLKTLTAESMNITDVSPFANILTIETLDLSGNSVTDVSPLATLVRLKALYVSDTYASNLEALVACSALTEIRCSGVSVSGAAMAALVGKGIKVIN